MYGEDKRTLDRLQELAEDNNRILHRLQRTARWASFWRGLKWLLVLAAILVSYYQLQPYFESLRGVYESVPKSTASWAELIEQALKPKPR
ncbi:MAG: hypothetical protein AAB468_03130 [Patescibacteria group bacterium]